MCIVAWTEVQLFRLTHEHAPFNAESEYWVDDGNVRWVTAKPDSDDTEYIVDSLTSALFPDRIPQHMQMHVGGNGAQSVASHRHVVVSCLAVHAAHKRFRDSENRYKPSQGDWLAICTGRKGLVFETSIVYSVIESASEFPTKGSAEHG